MDAGVGFPALFPHSAANYGGLVPFSSHKLGHVMMMVTFY